MRRKAVSDAGTTSSLTPTGIKRTTSDVYAGNIATIAREAIAATTRNGATLHVHGTPNQYSLIQRALLAVQQYKILMRQKLKCEVRNKTRLVDCHSEGSDFKNYFEILVWTAFVCCVCN